MVEAQHGEGAVGTVLPRRSILVLGMHRSGTSALTRALGLCGADLPQRLVEADPAINARGFWEPRALVDLHDEMLAAAGSSWHDVLSLPEGWLAGEGQRFRARAKDLLLQEFDGSTLSLVKDPRLCRLLPFWRPILAELEIEPCVVIVVRNPLEVAASLHKREGFEEGKALLLWLRHLLAAERDSRGLRRCFVAYHQLLADWRGTVARIGRALDIDWPRSPCAAAPEIEAFLSKGLRHHAFDPGDLFGRNDLTAPVKDSYAWALRAAEGSEPPPAPLDRIDDEVTRSEQIFAPVIVALETAAKRQAQTLHHWVGVAEDRFTLIEHFRRELEEMRASAETES